MIPIPTIKKLPRTKKAVLYAEVPEELVESLKNLASNENVRMTTLIQEAVSALLIDRLQKRH